MNRSLGSPGFTIPDIIMSLSIIAVAIVGIMVAQNNYVQSSSRVEIGLRAISLGNSVMNTIRSHRYDENTGSPWSGTLGPDMGESSLADYDDIDDYDGADWDFSSDGFSGFTVDTQVFPVNLSTSWLAEVAPPTTFKRIIVTIDHAVLTTPVIFTSLMGGIEG